MRGLTMGSNPFWMCIQYCSACVCNIYFAHRIQKMSCFIASSVCDKNQILNFCCCCNFKRGRQFFDRKLNSTSRLRNSFSLLLSNILKFFLQFWAILSFDLKFETCCWNLIKLNCPILSNLSKQDLQKHGLDKPRLVKHGLDKHGLVKTWSCQTGSCQTGSCQNGSCQTGSCLTCGLFKHVRDMVLI